MKYSETVNVVGQSRDANGDRRFIEPEPPAGAGTNAASGSSNGGGGVPWWELGQQGLSTAGNLYSGKQQAKASRYAADQQAQANRAQLAYAQQKDYEAQLAAEAAQRGNYDMWRAGQQTSNDLLQAREQRLGNLGSLIGVPARAPITTDIPDYTPGPRPTRPTGGDTLRAYLNK